MTSYPADLATRVHKKLTKDKVKGPNVETLLKLFEVLYFASLKTEEGQRIPFSVTYSDPKNPDPNPPKRIRNYRWKHIPLEPNKLLTVRNLSKLAKAIDPWSSSLAVFPNSDGRLYIWGLIDQIVHFNTFLVRESDSGLDTPGLFQAVVRGPADITVYQEYNLTARLNQASIITSEVDVFGYGPINRKVMRDLAKYQTAVAKSARLSLRRCRDHWDEEENRLGTLCRILISIQRYRHGGALLISRSTDDLNVKYGLNYNRLPQALRRLAVSQVRSNIESGNISDDYLEENRDSIPLELYLDSEIAKDNLRDAEAEVTGCVRFVSALSCVDGLIHLRPDFTVDGFGAEITVRDEVPTLFRTFSARADPKSLKPTDPAHYGMRHRSMMRYCNAHPDSIGFVISQDGDIRTITRVGNKLIMWENVMVHFLWDAYLKRVKNRWAGEEQHS